jgi:hypothetical protein
VAGFTGGGRQLVAAMSDCWCVWTPESGARVDFQTPNSQTVIASGKPSGKPYDVKRDEPLGALGRVDGAIEIWHLNTGALVSAWPAHDDGIGAVAFSADGKRLATGSIKGEVKIWDFVTQRGGTFRAGRSHLSAAFSRMENSAISGRATNVWLWTMASDKIQQLGTLSHFRLRCISPTRALATPHWQRSFGNCLPSKHHHAQGPRGYTAAAFSRRKTPPSGTDNR